MNSLQGSAALRLSKKKSSTVAITRLDVEMIVKGCRTDGLMTDECLSDFWTPDLISHLFLSVKREENLLGHHG